MLNLKAMHKLETKLYTYIHGSYGCFIIYVTSYSAFVFTVQLNEAIKDQRVIDICFLRHYCNHA